VDKVKVKAKAKAAGEDTRLVDDLVGELIKVGGEGTAIVLGSDDLSVKIRGVISTQCPAIDKALGRGGVPFGRLTIIHGPEASGKTTLCLHLVAECLRMDGVVVYIDKEYKLDPDYAMALGVDPKRLVISQPPYLEKAFETMDAVITMAKKRREATGVRVPILIVLDSMNSAITKREFEGDWEDEHMAPGARVYSRLLPKLIPKVSSEDVALVFISQIREKMNITYGNKDEIAGGKAPKFYASVIMDVHRKEAVTKAGKKDSEGKETKGEAVGNECEVYVRKNQVAKPFKRANFRIYYGEGIDNAGAVLQWGEELGVVEKAGTWFSFAGERLGQGFEAARNHLKKHKDVSDAIRAKCEEVEAKD
jgi:recombination protein RecA